MRFAKIISIFSVFILINENLRSQELEFDEGIYYEKPNNKDTSAHRYTLDNISYKLNMVFMYDYYYKDNSGIKKKFIQKNKYSDENPMNLTTYDDPSDSTIDKIKIEISDFLNFFARGDSTYTQTVFGYSYLNKRGHRLDTTCESAKRKNKKMTFPCEDEGTGIIDNKKNVWIHPPRSFSFKILELNPFPFYYLDESIKRWTWKLEVGGFYLDPRWINWKEVITINYEYIRVNDETLITPLGNISCKVTNAVATSEYGSSLMKTFLKSYYHPKYGFVRLEYVNINGSKIVIQLIDVKG